MTSKSFSDLQSLNSTGSSPSRPVASPKSTSDLTKLTSGKSYGFELTPLVPPQITKPIILNRGRNQSGSNEGTSLLRNDAASVSFQDSIEYQSHTDHNPKPIKLTVMTPSSSMNSFEDYVTKVSTKAAGIYNSVSTTDLSGLDDDTTEFFTAINSEIEKVNKFYIGKIAELRTRLDEIVKKRSNTYRSHHIGGSDVSDITKLRDIYVELSALQNFSELNKTGENVSLG